MAKTKKTTKTKKTIPSKVDGYGRFLPTRWPKKLKISAIIVLIVFFVGLIAIKAYLPINIEAPRNSISTQGAVTLKLGQLLRSVDTSKITLTPAVEGNWDYQRGNILGGDKLIFVPKKYFKENTTYTADFPAANRLLGGTVKLPVFTFTTEKAPLLSKKNGCWRLERWSRCSA